MKHYLLLPPHRPTAIRYLWPRKNGAAVKARINNKYQTTARESNFYLYVLSELGANVHVVYR